MNPLVSRSMRRVLAVVTMFIVTCVSFAQNNRPGPQRPERQGTPAADRGAATDLPPGDATVVPAATRPNRTRLPREGKVVLAFNETPLEEVIPFIVESTGKVVMPVGLQQLKIKKITLINDEPVDRAAALDLLVTALRLNGVGVIETDQVVILDLIENIKIKTPPVLTAADDVLNRTDLGTFIVKIYRLKEAGAENVHDKLTENIPDYATLNFDPNSNQIILYGDVGLAQHYQRMINELDRNYVKIVTRTFRLAYADAELVATQIEELFQPSETATGGGTTGTRQTRGQGRQPPRAAGGGGAAGGAVSATPTGAGTPGPVVELRISVNTQMNAVTVSAEPATVDQITKLINEQWDLPRPEETAKVYHLKHTDPMKVRELLLNLLGQGTGSTSGRTGTRAGGAAGRANQGAGAGGAGGGTSVSQAIGDIYRIEGFPDQSKLVVLSRTKESLNYLDAIIEGIDQPTNIGIPELVELKHADAVDLANVINVLLAETGSDGGRIAAPTEGLTAPGFDIEGGDGATNGTGGQTSGGTAGGNDGDLQFPWQSGTLDDNQSEPSPLIGKVRIVPYIPQNALSVVSPAEYRQAIMDLIQQLDRPGRQVMISAVIAQVELTDDLALGLRFSNQELVTGSADNVLGGSANFEGSKEDILGSLFDTSVLDVNAELNVILQMLAQKTNVRILQEPRVFTADNQEAIFFNGQQVPILESTNTTDGGSFQQSVEQQNVGVLLNVRPRITVQRDVDMEINLELSNIVPGQTAFGQFIFDKRQTKTKVIVKNGQTIVLSGILTDTDSRITRGIPLLSDIPFIGDLFKSHENQKKSTELIAFITPVVVDNPSENDHNFNESAREHLKDLAKPLKEQAKNRKAIRERIVAPKTEQTPILPQGANGNDNGRRNDDEDEDEAPVDIDQLNEDSR